MKRSILILLAIPLVLLFILIFRQRPYIVSINNVSYGSISDEITLSGIVKSEKIERYIYPFREAKVTRIRKSGDTVKKGDVLFILEDKDIENAHRISVLNHEKIKYRLNNLEIMMKQKKDLYNRGLIPEDEFLIHENNYNIGLNELRTAQIETERTKLNLDTVNRTAPFNGVVLDSALKESAIVNPNAYIMTFADTTSIYIESFAGDFDRHRLKDIKEIYVSLDYMDNEEKYLAELVSSSVISTPTADGRTNYRVIFRFSSSIPDVLFNSNCRIDVILKEYTNVHYFSNQALFERDGKNFVWGVKGNKAFLHEVKDYKNVKGNIAVFDDMPYKRVIAEPYKINVKKRVIPVKEKSRDEFKGFF